jgi:sigma-E factor negative regulatory protein RseB
MVLQRYLIAAFGVFTVLASAAQAADAPSVESAPETRVWLTRIHQAASQRNYQGTQVFTAGGVSSSSRVAHYCEGTQQYERVEILDGQTRRVLRHNEVVYTVWPQRQLAVIEQREPLPPFPALLQPGEDRLIEHYELRSQGHERVAGYDAQVFLLRPRDAYRFAQRLWAEKASGLLLRSDVVGPHDEVLESTAFSEVAIGVRPQPDQVLQPMRKLDGYRVVRPVLAHTELEGEGWAMKQTAPGFRQISCVKRPLDATELTSAPANAEVLQAIYSDGLTHVSVFIEPFNPQRHLRPMITSVGATHTLMQRQAGWWITVVGDVPPTTLKLFAAGLERRR